MNERPDWRRDTSSSQAVCIRCLEEKPSRELDRLLWCEDCLERAQARSARRGWIVGGVLALLLAIYISLWIRPDWSLIPAGWAATLLVAFYLGGRVARELFFGWERAMNRQAVEATTASFDDTIP